MVIVVMSVIVMLYLLIIRPLKEIIELISLLVNETILLVTNICVLYLAILGPLGDQDVETYNNTRYILGEVIVYANLTFNSLTMVFLILPWIVIVVRAYKYVKKVRQTRRVTLMQLLIEYLTGEKTEEVKKKSGNVQVISRKGIKTDDDGVIPNIKEKQTIYTWDNQTGIK